MINFNNNNSDYDFDSNNQDDVIFNGAMTDHSINDFQQIQSDVNDLDTLDYENNEVYYEW